MYRLLRHSIALLISLLAPIIVMGQQVQSSVAPAATPTGLPWSKPNTIHYVQDEDLASLLRTFCATQNMNALVDSHIYGKVNG
ncbi:MAG TPA: hypothetical protein PLV25_06430, partial [Opitutales bacterium]|nr:hypothetical protein [Opitutales bacterium]